MSSIATAPLAVPDNMYYVPQALLQRYRHIGTVTELGPYIDALVVLEALQDPNADNHYLSGLQTLARLTGTWRDSAAAWKQWHQQQ